LQEVLVLLITIASQHYGSDSFALERPEQCPYDLILPSMSVEVALRVDLHLIRRALIA
jgi:hypothetical protein